MKPTQKKEVNLYLLRGYEQSPEPSEPLASIETAPGAGGALGEFLASAPWDLGIAGGRAAGKLQLPANLAAYTKCAACTHTQRFTV